MIFIRKLNPLFSVTGQDVSHAFPLKKKKVTSSAVVYYFVGHGGLDTCLMRSAVGPSLMKKNNGTWQVPWPTSCRALPMMRTPPSEVFILWLIIKNSLNQQ